MRYIARILLATLVLVNLFAQGNDAPSILRSSLKATEKIDTIEYEVRRMSKASDGKLRYSRSTILAQRSPFGFVARYQNEDTGIRDMAVLDGEVTRYSADGVAGEVPRTFISAGQVIPNAASADAAITWRLLLDRDYVSTAIDSGSIVYAGKDDVDGELCRIVAYVRVSEESGSTIDWYWISSKTGLPRAVQRGNLRRGTTRLTDRAVISILRMNPRIPPDAFTYRPTPADSSPDAAPAPRASSRDLRGMRLPDLELKDIAYNSVKLSDLVGMPLLIVLWAPWFGAREEMQTLAKLEPAFRGKLRVVAIAVQDSHLNVLSWIKDHPQYDFTFLTDPELPEKTSRLSTQFGVVGVPVNVLVGADGTVIENWGGYQAEELEKRLAKFLSMNRER